MSNTLSMSAGSDSMSFVTGSSDPITASFSKVTPALWAWVVICIAAVFFAGLFMYVMKSKKAGEPEKAQTDSASPPPSQGE